MIGTAAIAAMRKSTRKALMLVRSTCIGVVAGTTAPEAVACPIATTTRQAIAATCSSSASVCFLSLHSQDILLTYRGVRKKEKEQQFVKKIDFGIKRERDICVWQQSGWRTWWRFLQRQQRHFQQKSNNLIFAMLHCITFNYCCPVKLLSFDKIGGTLA